VLQLDGKTAIVTGAANGIGRAIVERFVAEGMKVVGVDIDAAALGNSIAPYGDQVVASPADISDRAQVAAAVRTAIDRFGCLDVLAANAGIADGEPFLEITDRSWQRIINVNITGTFHCVQEAAKAMVPNRKGAIVCTSSTNAWYVEKNLAHYNTSKGGVHALVRSAAIDLGEYGIRVNAIEPSMVKTRAAFITEDPVGGPEYLKRVPMGRFAEPSEIAAAVAWLASDQSSYITGQALTLDGGLTLGIDMPLPAAPLPGSARADSPG
jgi:NAD(P)-dependent dehydrogenase (short-subunit alcohol dehydrogenase family)